MKTLANIADALNVTLSELFAGLAEGPDELDTPAPRGATIEPTPRVRAGQKTINVLLVELRAERAALQETVATLREVALGTMEKRKTPVRKRSPSPRRNRR